MTPVSIVKLDKSFEFDQFDCGNESLNNFLKRHALASDRSSSYATYLALADEKVVGYHSLVFGSVGIEEAPDRLGKGIARHPVPVMILSRLAVSREWQRKRIGRGLLKDSMKRTIAASEIVGLRTMAVHAKDNTVADYYRRFGFVDSPTNRLHLFLTLKDMRFSVGV